MRLRITDNKTSIPNAVIINLAHWVAKQLPDVVGVNTIRVGYRRSRYPNGYVTYRGAVRPVKFALPHPQEERYPLEISRKLRSGGTTTPCTLHSLHDGIIWISSLLFALQTKHALRLNTYKRNNFAYETAARVVLLAQTPEGQATLLTRLDQVVETTVDKIEKAIERAKGPTLDQQIERGLKAKKTWTRKLKLAQTKLKKIERKLKHLEKKKNEEQLP